MIKKEESKRSTRSLQGYVVVTILSMFIVFVCMGCTKGNEPEPGSIEDTKSDGPVIGFSFDSLVIERWQRDRDIFVSTAEELGASVIVQNANGEVEKQKKQIEYLIKKNVEIGRAHV